MKNTSLHRYHIVLESGKRILVSDCKGILEYTPERIRILLHSVTVSICGRDLTLSDFFGDEIQICGMIEGISIQGEKNEN